MIEDRLINISGDDINDVEITTKGPCIYLYYKGKEIKHISRVIITSQNIEITQGIIKHNMAEQVKKSTFNIKYYLIKLKELIGGK